MHQKQIVNSLFSVRDRPSMVIIVYVRDLHGPVKMYQYFRSV